MEEIDIWRTAKILIDSHGKRAWMEAAQRADHALSDGKLEVAAVWTRIWKAVQALQKQKPSASEYKH
jgi:hypothetical protein